uniref:Reverse transcriptase domain-containing protein n=1 Tax=Tanacetum cinerariifolium TaxID=118510 RepID=A0A699HTC1_TANCI|nr:reverse transcriptase domain-containing protein [Tanacetum cinerariifolium]
MMSSPNHPTSNIEDAFSSNFLDYTTASPYYFPASPRNISPDPPDNLSNYLFTSLAISPFHNVQAYIVVANKPPISPQDPVTPPTILTPSPVLPPSPLFDPRHFFVPKELLPPKKQIHPISSSLTTLSNSSRKQACILVLPSFSTYTPTPPQIYELGKSSIKMHAKHHEEQVESILSYLEELSFHCIEKMEERLVNGWIIIPRDFDEVKTKLKEARTEIRKLQKKRIGQRNKISFIHFRISNLEMTLEAIQDLHQLYMPPKRTSTSEAPVMTRAAIRKLVADNVTTTIETQAATMENTNNPNRNSGLRRTPIARKFTYEKFMSCQPFYFNGMEEAVGLILCLKQTESVFSRCNCAKKNKVKFAINTLTEEALFW